MNLKQRIQMLEDELDSEIQFSANLLDQISQLLFYFGKSMADHFQACNGKPWEGNNRTTEIACVREWVLSTHNDESPDLDKLRDEALKHYYHFMAYPVIQIEEPGGIKKFEDMMAEALFRRIAADWFGPLLQGRSNGGMA